MCVVIIYPYVVFCTLLDFSLLSSSLLQESGLPFLKTSKENQISLHS